jgi:phosphopantothenoylcysteine decarboxylase/phosphopantothenate--cysteine ligase
MHEAVIAAATDADAVFMAAAVSDWRPETRAASKEKKQDGQKTVAFVRTVDILSELGRNRDELGPVLVGWAAETGDPIAAAQEKLVRKGADLIVANNVAEPGAGFEVDTNVVTFVTADEQTAFPLQAKASIGRAFIRWLVDYLGARP